MSKDGRKESMKYLLKKENKYWTDKLDFNM